MLNRQKIAPTLGFLALGLLACKPDGKVVAPAPTAAKAAPEPSESVPDVSPPTAAPEPKPEIRKRPPQVDVQSRDAAIKAVTSGNPEGAAKFLGPLVKDKPKDDDARLAYARALLAVGSYTEAGKVLDDPKGNPNALAIARARVIVHRRVGELKQAEALLRKTVKKTPTAYSAWGDLLTILVDTGRRDDPEARRMMDNLYDAYESSKTKSAEDLLAVAKAALARRTNGGYKDANDVLGEAEAAAPAKQGSWTGDEVILLRGAMFLEKYAAQDAAETYELLLQRDAWDPEALSGMARVNVDSLRFAVASRTAQEVLQVNPSHPEAHTVLARIALIEGRRDEARRRVADHVFKVNTKHVGGLAVLAALALLEGDDKGYAAARDRALAFNAKNGTFYKDLSEILGFLHLYPQADEVLAEGVKIAPKDPYVRSALGLNLLRLGDETRGREALKKAWKGDKFNERTYNVLELYEKNIEPNYLDSKHPALTLRVPKQDAEFVQPELLRGIETARTSMDKLYGVAAGDLRLEFFHSPEEFSVRTVGVPSLGAVAVCFGQVITLVGPYRGVFNMDQVIWHELAHVYAIKRSRGRVPRWFTEGLSEWESEVADPAWSRESAQLLVQARAAGKLRKLGELELAFIRAESGAMMEVAYSTAAYAVRYLGTTYGRKKLIAMLDGYGTGAHTEALVKKHLGKDMATLEREFEQWFYAQLDAKVAGWTPDPAKLREEKPADPRHRLLRTAFEQIEKKQRDDAARTLQKLIGSGGDGYRVRITLAKLLVDGPKPAAAERHLLRARKFHAEAIEPLVLLARLAQERGQVDGEKRWLREALTIDADSIDPAARLLMLGLATDDAGSAKIGLTRVRAIAPLHPIALAGRAHGLAGRNKAGARKLLDRALTDLASGKGPAGTYVVAALAAVKLGDKATAKKMADVARKGSKLPKPVRAKLNAVAK